MSIDVRVQTVIARPLAEVAAFVVEPENERLWIDGIKESARETPGPIAAGSRVRRVAAFAGRRIAYTPEVLEYEHERRVLMRTDTPFPMTIEYAFAAEGDRTRFTQRLIGGPTGIAGLLSPLIATMVRRNVAADMERLRVLLEADTAPA